MKKLLLIPALMLGTVSMAKQFDYELTPVIGYNVSEGNLGLEDQYMIGAEIQYNGFDYAIKPELSYIYSNAKQISDVKDTPNIDINRIALNGVYEFGEDGDKILPLVKAGLGYEFMPDTAINKNESGVFFGAGVGAKIPLMDNNRLALKLEAVYEAKYTDLRNSNFDSNVALLAGITLAFGADDFKFPKDNSEELAKANAAAAEAQARADAAKRDADAAKRKAKAAAAASAAAAAALLAANADSDNDGVKNTIDKCPDTPAGYAVNAQGCMININLNINFDNASSNIDRGSEKNAQTFSKLLKASPSYNVDILGFTDSVGSEAFNQKLSQKRADAVKSMLVNQGVNKARISAKGMGEANPVSDNSTKEGRADNRRIEAKLIKTN